ncbi:DEAD/DEAH box helicase family protein [Alkalihalobacillus deserti]|uniref:DEAD/DEAH box helicase family protein n=1 Tax=Alkalihalobacillus deserti TaxID=2879466 RepID=UPI001D158220|nr:DEAD/DEAH box helicase family protein [Alkalihalobacillus deserti]
MYQKPLMIHSNERIIYLMEWLDSNGEIESKLLGFSTLIKAPEEVHTFHITPYSVWSAAAKDIRSDEIIDFLNRFSSNSLSDDLKEDIIQWVQDYGTLYLKRINGGLELIAKHSIIITKILQDEFVFERKIGEPTENTMYFNLADRAVLKERLFSLNLFVIDSTNIFGEPLEINIKPVTLQNQSFTLRAYQKEAINHYISNKDNAGGGGVIILPPGSGKTLVGLSIISKIKQATLIIVEDERCAEHWKEEIKDKTDFDPEHVSYINSENNEITPLTICTYPYLSQNDHAFNELMDKDWGLIIYDDAHRLPAETYMSTTNLSSKYKVALASTLARSDGRGDLIFPLIGPKWYETFPILLQKQGHIPIIDCIEIKVPLDEITGDKYNTAQIMRNNDDELRGIAAFNPMKEAVIKQILTKHWDKQILVASYRVNLGKELSEIFRKPIILAGKQENINLIEEFNINERDVLFGTSKVVEQSLFPNLDVLISISYHKGSEREEYLRVGKFFAVEDIRTKKKYFAVVSEMTVEEGDYVKRRRAMINYGFRFKIIEYRSIGEGRLNHES